MSSKTQASNSRDISYLNLQTSMPLSDQVLDLRGRKCSTVILILSARSTRKRSYILPCPLIVYLSIKPQSSQMSFTPLPEPNLTSSTFFEMLAKALLLLISNIIIASSPTTNSNPEKRDSHVWIGNLDKCVSFHTTTATLESFNPLQLVDSLGVVQECTPTARRS